MQYRNLDTEKGCLCRSVPDGLCAEDMNRQGWLKYLFESLAFPCVVGIQTQVPHTQ